MELFNEIARELGASDDVRRDALSVMSKAGVGSNDPQAERILLNLHMLELTRKQIEQSVKQIKDAGEASARRLVATSREASASVREMAGHSIQDANAKISATGATIADKLAGRIGENLEHAILRTVATKYNLSLLGFWVVSVVMAIVGFWGGIILARQQDGIMTGQVQADPLTAWLATFSPWSLLGAGAMAFIVLRVVCSYSIRASWIRWILAVPESRTKLWK